MTKSVRTGSLGWMIQRLAGRLNGMMEQRLAPHNLSLQQFAIMMTTLETDGLSQTEIGGKFAMPAYAISRGVDHLEKQGYLERRPHPTSRRTLTVHTTEKGRDLSSSLFAIVKEVNQELTEGLAKDEQAMLKGLLEKLLLDQMGVA